MTDIDALRAIYDGCMTIFNTVISFGGYHFTLWQVLLGSGTIAVTSRIIWGRAKNG